MSYSNLILVSLILLPLVAQAAYPQLSTKSLQLARPLPASAKGALLGVLSYANETIAVVRIDKDTGEVGMLDMDFEQKGTSYIYYSASTADINRGIYYVSLISGESSSLLVSIDVRSGKTINQVVQPDNFFFLLGHDVKLNALFGVAINPETTVSTLYQLDPNTFKATPIGDFPAGIPLDNAGHYDPVHGIMYFFYATGARATSFAGMNVRTGKIEVVAPVSRDSIYFTVFYDSGKQRIISIAQNLSGANEYYLATLNEKGEGKPIGEFSVSPRGFYPTVSGISPLTREYYSIMSTDNQIEFVISDLDTGKMMHKISNWGYIPINLCWVPLK